MKIFCSSALLAVFTLAPAYAENEKILQLVIEAVMFDSVITHIPFEKDVLQSFKEREIFDVYERKEEIAGKTIYAGFVDSVYLTSSEFLQVADKYKLTFALVWEGEDKNLASGQYLVPTGRIFAVDGRADAHGAAANVIAGSGQIDLADGFDLYILGGSALNMYMFMSDDFGLIFYGVYVGAESMFRIARSYLLRIAVQTNVTTFFSDIGIELEYLYNVKLFDGILACPYIGVGVFIDTIEPDSYTHVLSRCGLFLEFISTRFVVDLSVTARIYMWGAVSPFLNLMFGYRVL